VKGKDGKDCTGTVRWGVCMAYILFICISGYLAFA
jgi:hypothetical protein